jgi:hypothetical protein
MMGRVEDGWIVGWLVISAVEMCTDLQQMCFVMRQARQEQKSGRGFRTNEIPDAFWGEDE